MENKMIKFNKPLFSLKSLSIFGAIVIVALLTLGFFFSTDADGAEENVQYIDFPPLLVKAKPIIELPPIHIIASPSVD